MKLYDFICLFTWHCVGNDYGGIGINLVVTSGEIGFFYSMHLVLHALTIDRFILAFLGVRTHRFAQYLISVYMAVMCFLPLAPMWMMVGKITDRDKECWGGFWFDPTTFKATLNFYQDPEAAELFNQMRSASVVVMMGTIALNMAAFWRFKIMLVLTNVAFFFDVLLVKITDKATFFRREVWANMTQVYRYHASVFIAGMLFFCYVSTCRAQGKADIRHPPRRTFASVIAMVRRTSKTQSH
ncbi:unnamed protein product, partial [Mesorhabditis spiculigera]